MPLLSLDEMVAKQGLRRVFRQAQVVKTEEERQKLCEKWLEWLARCDELGCLYDEEIRGACTLMLDDDQFKGIAPRTRYAIQTVLNDAKDRSTSISEAQFSTPRSIFTTDSASVHTSSNTPNGNVMNEELRQETRTRRREDARGLHFNARSKQPPSTSIRISSTIEDGFTPEPSGPPVSRSSFRIKERALDSLVQNAIQDILDNGAENPSLELFEPPDGMTNVLPSNAKVPFAPSCNSH